MNDCRHPSCFGDLEAVFPLAAEGLRQSPATCMRCALKTECLHTTLERPQALAVREEMIERAYRGGLIGTIQRWSRKKALHRAKQSL